MRDYGIGMFSCPQNETDRRMSMKMFEIIAKKEGVTVLGWRMVPVTPGILGSKALVCHASYSAFKKDQLVQKGLEFDHKLYVIRRIFEQSNDNTYVVSLSSRTIVYKGMFLVGQLRISTTIYKDEAYVLQSRLFLRFSTNTNPSWQRVIRTATWYITVRSILSAAMWIRC